MNPVQPIPSDYGTVTPYLNIRGAVAAIEFYKQAFGARELYRLAMPDGTIAHAEIKIGDSKIMLAEESEQWGNKSPQTLNGSPVSLCIYVDNVDAVFAKAIALGAKAVGEMTVKDQFYGDRTGSITDPFEHRWTIMTRIEDVSPEEMKKRSDALFSQPDGS
ncbi:MAG: VOC family protein [Ilumatobacteraceae bacterium]